MCTNEEMRQFFDNLAPSWDNSPQEYDVRERITALMDLPPTATIADIGCGKGVMFEHLLQTAPDKLIAVDISSEMLKSAGESFSDQRIEYINGDALEVKLPELDVAIIFNAYPHFLDKKALAEKLAAVIKPGGMLVIAHSRGRVAINGFHRGEHASRLSTPLEAAELEAAKFTPHFTAERLVDEDSLYFIKMIRI